MQWTNGEAPLIKIHPCNLWVYNNNYYFGYCNSLLIIVEEKEEGWNADFSHQVNIYKDRKRKNSKLSTS